MAAANAIDEHDAEFFADSDSEADFEGFGDEDIERADVYRENRNIFDIPELDNDPEIPIDRAAGWLKTSNNPEVFDFTVDAPGISPTIDTTDLKSPIDYFNLFLKDADFHSWAVETNNYARQVMQSRPNLPPNSRMRKWIDITANEMKQWLGLIIITGLVQKPSMEDYWSTDPVISTPIFSSTMPRDRFLNILTFFHLNDNTNYIPRGQDNFDPLFKVRPIYDVANQRFLSTYTPKQHISIDEGMVPWRGRLSFRQYIPNKPDKFGMKLYILCDSSNGYISLFDCYTGRDYDPNPERENHELEEGHSYQVVIGLLRRASLLNKGYMLFLDNYYSSPILFDNLNNQSTSAVGTVRLNRKQIPSAVKNANLKKGEVVYRQRGNLLALKWKDKRDVSLLSTVHRATFTVTNRIVHATGESVTVPSPIVLYNKYMGGVDHADQLNKYYTVTRKTIKWWKKLAFHIINLVITNAYIIQKEHARKPLSHYTFRKELARTLTTAFSQELNPKGRRHVGNPQVRLAEKHFPSEIPAQPGAKRQNPCRKCVACKPVTGKRHEAGAMPKSKSTRYWCADCGVALCVTPCFKNYHTLKNYKQGSSRRPREEPESSSESSSVENDELTGNM
jgi:hypothetical protein